MRCGPARAGEARRELAPSGAAYNRSAEGAADPHQRRGLIHSVKTPTRHLKGPPVRASGIRQRQGIDPRRFRLARRVRTVRMTR